MKQSEYLYELKKNLETKVTPEVLKDILSDYESFFISGKEDGKTDDEISKELGPPAYLAKSLNEGHNINETGQPDKRIASPGRRICAYLTDAIIAVIPALVLSLFLGIIVLPYLMLIMYPSPVAGATASMGYSAFEVYSITETNESGEKATTVENWKDGRKPSSIITIMAVLSLAFYLFYSFVCTLLFKGQTIGKKLLKIKVRCSNTQPVTSGVVFSREFLCKTLINSIPIIPLVSFFTILFTKEHKALHDMLAGTIVSDV